MKKTHGQTATEYLVILAIVIIIALIVVAVLGGIPSIGGSAGTQALSAYWATSRIGVSSIAIANSTTVSDVIILKNNLPYTITITGVELGPTSSSLQTLNISSLVVAAGAPVTVSNTSIAGVRGKFSSCIAGTTFALDLRVNYTEGPTGAAQTFVGDGRLQGICSN